MGIKLAYCAPWQVMMVFGRVGFFSAILVALAVGGSFWAGCTGFPDLSGEVSLGRSRPGFVDTQGTSFVLDGQAIHFVGANLGGIQSLWANESRDMVVNAEAFVEAAAGCCNLVRVWAFGDGANRDPERFESLVNFRMGPDRKLENAYLVLDHILAAARRRGIKVSIVLSNFWADYGGIQRYYEWFNLPPSAPHTRPARKTATAQEARFFFTDVRAKAAYKSHVRSIVRRVNSVNGIGYQDDPTIVSYELMNEIRAVPEIESEQYAWAHQMSTFVKRLDPHHLVSTGFDHPHGSLTGWVHAGRLPNVDYLDVHVYPQDEATRHNPVDDWDSLWSYLRSSSNAASDGASKPVMLGEFNFPGVSDASFGFETRDEARLAIARVMEQALKNMGFGGALFWHLSTLESERQYTINPSIPDDAIALDRIREVRDSFSH